MCKNKMSGALNLTKLQEQKVDFGIKHRFYFFLPPVP